MFSSCAIIALQQDPAKFQCFLTFKRLLSIIWLFLLALAFCNNSEPQKKRRQILQKFTFPHSHSDLGTYLDNLCVDECQQLTNAIQKEISDNGSSSMEIDLKPWIMKSCANIFNRYFCSVERCEYDDEEFTHYCQSFDKVFWEVNNGRAVDFLPWLMPFFQYSEAVHVMKSSSEDVRSYVKENIIASKRQRRNSGVEKTVDFLDTIMDYIDGKANDDSVDPILTSQSALYALEDILGGHSAVANIILRILFDLALEENVEAKKEVTQQISQTSTTNLISVEDRPSLPRVVASMHETIRLTCSPIVPHQATQDSTIEGTVVPLNSRNF